MVKHNNQNIADEIDKLNENESSAVLRYISNPLDKRISNRLFFNDDLIVSLADAYENKRARQVFEWEKIRRRQNGFSGI